MNSSILYVNSKKDYFYFADDSCQQILKDGRRYRLIAKFFSVIGIKAPNWVLNDRARLIESDRVVITDSAFEQSLYQRAIFEKGRSNVYVYIMNPLDRIKENKIKTIFNNVGKDKIYTFSKSEAEIYNIKYIHTPYSNSFASSVSSKTPKYDLIFLGKDKGRMQYIKNIYDYLSNKGYRLKFMVLTKKKEDLSITINKRISYQDYISLVSESKAILEITQENQKGCTLRFLEAIYFGKKLITTNTSALDDEYFDSRFMSVLSSSQNEEDLMELVNRIDSPTVTNITRPKELDCPHWLKYFE